MTEKIEFLPVRVETSYVSISQLNVGIQLALASGMQGMAQTNLAAVFAPQVHM